MADVKWGVDVDVKAGKITAGTTALERLEKTLGRIDISTSKVADHMDKLGSHAREAGDHAHSMFSQILTAELAKDAIKELVKSVVELGEKIVETAADEQRMQTIFEAQAGSKEIGRQNKEWTDQLALRTELNEKQAESAFLELKRVGATDQAAKLAEKAAADIAAVNPNKDEAFSAAISAFQRIERTGQVSNRALAPLGIGVKDFKTLPSMAGLSDKAIKKQLESGKVDRNDLFQLIMSRAGEKSIGERASAASGLLQTKLSKLSELPERFYKKLADTGALNTLSAALDRVLSKLDPDSPTGKKIVGFLEGAFEGGVSMVEKLVDAFDGIDFEEVADGVKGFVSALREALGVVVDIAKKIGEVSGVGEFISRIGAQHRRTQELLEAKKAIAEGREVPVNQATIQAGIAPANQLISPGVRAWHGKFHMIGDDAAAGVKEGMESGLQIKSPSRVTEHIGEMTAAGFAGGLSKGQPAIDRATSVTPLPAPGAQSSTIQVTIESPQIVISGAGGVAEGIAAADAFTARVREALAGVLDQMAAERGVA